MRTHAEARRRGGLMARRKRTSPTPRKQPSAGRATFTVDAIVTAVERVLEQHGAQGLNTNRVAEIAGVSVGTLYQYFPNKESLVGVLQERYLEITFRLCRAVLAAAAEVPIGDLIDRVAGALLAANLEQRPIHRWLVELRSLAAFQERRRQALDQFAGELAAFLATRGFADPTATAFTLVHAVEGITSAATARPGAVDVTAIAGEACKMLRAYLTP
ncbi:MAG: TetR/AcrR family transcriptional regulator [Kofleriaceae bacterium]